MLELEDIQHFLLARTPALAARYEFLTFREPRHGQAWLSTIMEKVGSAKEVGSEKPDSRWVTVAFTWNGLRAMGMDDASLETFPEEFRLGMAGRADVIGTTGKNNPKHWVDGLASPDLHAVILLFARDIAERKRCALEHQRFLRECRVEVLSSLDLGALPPYDHAHEHFGYRDRLSESVVEGAGFEPTPGSGKPLKPGEFFLGYPDETGLQPALPEPEVLSRNGSYVAYIRLQEHVGAFRDFLRQHGDTPEERELVAAKLMGRWRSGAPLVLSPDKDDPDLGKDRQRTNNFDYGTMDPYGYACPLGSHIRRMNPRDTAENVERRRMIRRGGTYGPPLPEDAPEDGVERGIAAFVGCASLARQFEFAMNVWANDPEFHELGNERDPLFGTQDGTYDFTIPHRPIRKKIKGLPAFTTVRGGAYFFLPGIKALRFLAAGGSNRSAEKSNGESTRTYNQVHIPRKYTRGKRRVSIYIAWSYPAEANRDVTTLDNRYSTLTEVRRVAWPAFESPPFGDARTFSQGISGSLELFFRAWEPFQRLVREVTGHAVPVFQRVDHAGYQLPLDERVLEDADTLLVFGLDHMVTGQDASAAEMAAVEQFLAREGTCLLIGPHHDVEVASDLKEREVEYVHHGDALVPRQQRFGMYTRSLMKGLGIPVENRYGLRPAVEENKTVCPLSINRDLDTAGWLTGVTSFNFHMHLPHYALTEADANSVKVLATQPIDLSRPHPFTQAGNREFNAFLWMPAAGKRAGNILMADSTVFSTLFGVDESLERFWRNIVTET